jgi:ferredoxin--NADP+ reductase
MLRIAIVGAGPTGFFLADKLLGQEATPVSVDLFERLPTPYGLVRYGVAPDHEKIRNVTRSFDKVAARAGFRFFGNVDIGNHVILEDLRSAYHQICLTTGAQTDRQMGIPGEDLPGSHAATEFVAWYNGHPDYRDCVFDLSAERVAVVGVGNVAVDVARILCRTPEELGTTDIADHALEALRDSNGDLIKFNFGNTNWIPLMLRNSSFIIHPEEILADNFATLMEWRSDGVLPPANPDGFPVNDVDLLTAIDHVLTSGC